MIVLDLFSGIGGFSLGLERAGMETVAFCELNPFCRAVLEKHWPRVSKHRDILELDGEDYYRIDVICGGFPCQAFSSAARGRNVAANLWPEMFRVIQESAPRYVIAENVKRSPIEAAAEQLEIIGYNAVTRNISADACGAPHARSRWWVIAHTNNQGELQRAINAEVAKLPQLCEGLWTAETYARAVRVSNGIPHRVDRIESLGNALIPAIPEALGRAISSIEATTPPQESQI